VTLNLTYIPNVQFAPFYDAIENGYFADAGLNVTLNYGNEADLIALVGSGNQQFMIASGEQVLMGAPRGCCGDGLQLVQGVPGRHCFAGGKKFTRPMDLKGKTIGLRVYTARTISASKRSRKTRVCMDSDYSLQSIGYTQVESLVSGLWTRR
jgi:NitT/TauT family transport system substrate-binding protein